MKEKIIQIIDKAEQDFTAQIMHCKYDNPEHIPRREEMIAAAVCEFLKEQLRMCSDEKAAELERYKGVIRLPEEDIASIKAETVKDFGKMLINKGEKGIIYTMDIPDYVREYTEKENK